MSFSFRIAAFTLGLVCSAAAQAADDAVARYKNHMPRQITEMSPAERSSSVPLNLIWAANLAVSDKGDVVFQSQLNSLMYNGLADYERAKKEFQRDLGDEPTGKLTVGQIYTLGYRASRLNLTQVSFFPLDFGGTLSADAAVVKGTSKIIDERIAYPVNYTVVECLRKEGYCHYRQIALTLPDEKSWTQSYYIGEIANEYYKITRWENNQIDATPYNDTACRINQLSFNFATKEYFEIARNNTAGDCNTTVGITLPRLPKPRVSQIVDGQDIVAAEFRRLSNEAYGYYSGEFKKRIAGTKTSREVDR
ncbi:hypothetical protein NOJ05_18040 [Neorhizobium galegae]|nr:hypothetical protein [Neorhizobium galegae]MCQ1779108.1 hypothetical protein [Neorhizobium galegae]MCQ1799217.1 hypothetical protein [Neorhizobium galegae]